MQKIFFLSDDYMYEYSDGRVVKKELKKEDGIYTSVIYFKDIFNHTFKLPADLSEEELLIKAEETVYNEATLDLEKEYKINYKFQKVDNYYLVDAFIVEIDKLEDIFSPVLKTVNYIDFISAAPFVFQEYYEIGSIIPRNDIFIYFTPTDAFVAGFKEKNFVFVKSLDKFSTLSIQTQLSSEELIKILEEKGLDKSLYEKEGLFNSIEQFFSQFFMKVNNLVNYTKNFYHIDKIDRIYFYSNIKIKNLIENYENFWHLSGIEFKKFEIETAYDAFEYCATIYNANHYLNEEENFSIFLRPPKFYKTESGKLIIFSVVVIFLVLADAMYKFYVIKSQEEKLTRLQTTLTEREKKLKLLISKIKSYENKIKQEQDAIVNINKQISDINTKIDYLYNLKLKEPLYNEIADIVNFLIKNNLKLMKFEKVNTKYVIILQSNKYNSKLIAKFINYLITLGYKNVNSKAIINQKNNYVTQIRFYGE
jgi:hypothetical protein